MVRPLLQAAGDPNDPGDLSDPADMGGARGWNSLLFFDLSPPVLQNPATGPPPLSPRKTARYEEWCGGK